MNVAPLDLIIIAVYFVGIICFGLWISRKQASGGREFFLAGQQMKWPMIGASMFATNISSQQFVGQAGLAFAVGIVAGGFQLVGAFCFLLLAVVFLKTYIGLGLTTSPEFFERRYDMRARRIVSFINIMLVLLGNIAAALYAGSLVLSDLFGWAALENADMFFILGVGIIGVAAGAYTLLGGLRAIMYLDFLQMIVLVGGGLLLLVFGIQAAGGLGPAFASLETPEGNNAWNLILPWDHPLGWLPMLTGVLILGIHGHCTDQDYVQRALAAQNLYQAKMGALFGSFLKVLALFAIAAPGVMAAKLVQTGDLAVPVQDAAYSAMVTNILPIGITGICLAGLLAAIMSSVDSGLCAVGSLITYDFLGTSRKRRGESDASQLGEGRVVMLIVLVLCMMIAPLIRDFEGLFNYLLFVWSLLAPPVFVCVLFGLFYSRATARAAFYTLILGIVLAVVAFCFLQLPQFAELRTSTPVYLQNKLNLGFLIAIVCALALILISRFGGATPADREKASQIAQARDRGEEMTPAETTKVRLAVGVMLLLILGVTLLFSPLGMGQ
ncbi:MAG: SLC5 family protein [Verrucomicrobiota bacterium]